MSDTVDTQVKRVFITRKIPAIGIKLLREKGYEVDVSIKDGILTPEEMVLALKAKEYDAVISLLTDKIDAAVFDAAPKAKIFANYAVGFNNIDVAEAAKRAIMITNTPGALTESVVEHTLALILALVCRIVEGDTMVRAGKFAGWGPMLLLGTDLKGKVLGILGTGRIGADLARKMSRGLEMRVVYYDVVRNAALEKDVGAEFRQSPDDVMKEADVVSVHVPLLDSTRHLVNADRLKMMKPTAYLVNTSRGPVIDEVALVEALRAGTIRGAGLDVFENEPKLAPGLADLPNVVLTPHIASATDAARNEMAELAAKNVIEALEGRTPANLVKV